MFRLCRRCGDPGGDLLDIYISETLEDMAVVAIQIGLSMNNAKTKYMVNRMDNNNEQRKMK
jgi:hypothetical protein